MAWYHHVQGVVGSGLPFETVDKMIASARAIHNFDSDMCNASTCPKAYIPIKLKDETGKVYIAVNGTVTEEEFYNESVAGRCSTCS